MRCAWRSEEVDKGYDGDVRSWQPSIDVYKGPEVDVKRWSY
jgi:hypothetical protein